MEDGATTGLVDTGQTVVVRGGAMRSDGGFGAELRLLASLRHDHVWPLLASSVSDATGWMVFQFPQYGDLNTHLKRLVDPIEYVPAQWFPVFSDCFQFFFNRSA